MKSVQVVVLCLLFVTGCVVGGNGKPPDGPPGQPNLPFKTGVASPEGNYYGELSKRIMSYWRPPVELEDRLGDEGLKVRLLLSLTKGGALDNLAVIAPSGEPMLDNSALKALIDSAPYPAPPASLIGQERVANMSWNFSARP